MRSYYEAYDERYRAIHNRGLRWASAEPTPIVLETLRRLKLPQEAGILELGCGEGRDALAVLGAGYDLLATDCSPEAIAFCRRLAGDRADCFRQLDFLRDTLEERFAFIYAVAVLHMLVEDEDRRGLCRFVYEHLRPGGCALLCSMGDGETVFRTDPCEAFCLRERQHPSGPVRVAATTCRMVNWPVFEKEIRESGLVIAEKGITEALPDFDQLMYVLARRPEAAL